VWSGQNFSPPILSARCRVLPSVREKVTAVLSDFSSNLNRNKVPGDWSDYDDPVKSKMCPPITASPFAHISVLKKESNTEGLWREFIGSVRGGISEEQQPSHIFSSTLPSVPVDPGRSHFT
jgi:hypothetical protein